MTLQASGPISLSNVAVELGRASNAATSLGETAVRTLAGVSTGAIALSNLYGKSNGGTETIELAGPWDFSEVAATTSFALYSDGSIYGGSGQAGTYQGLKWITPQSNMSGYEARATVQAGSALSGGSGVGSWLNLGTTRNWYLTVPKGQANYTTLLIEVRNATTLQVKDTTTAVLGRDATFTTMTL